MTFYVTYLPPYRTQQVWIFSWLKDNDRKTEDACKLLSSIYYRCPLTPCFGKSFPKQSYGIHPCIFVSLGYNKIPSDLWN